MRRLSTLLVIGGIGALTAVLGVASCGGSSSNPTSTPTPTQPSVAPLTQAQITALENAISATENLVAPRVLSQSAADYDSNSQTITLNVSQFCTDSGSVSITGTVTFVNGPAVGAVTLKGNMTVGFSKCIMGGVTLDGTLSNIGAMNFVGVNTNSATVVNPVTFTISGTHSFVLNGITGSITFNCPSSITVDINSGTASAVAATGNATLQYPTGQNTTTAPCSAFATGFNGVFTVTRDGVRRLQLGRSPATTVN